MTSPDINKTNKEIIIQMILSRAQTRVLYKPIGDLALSVVNATSECIQEIKSFLRQSSDHQQRADKVLLEMLVTFELTGFFFHLMNRQAYQSFDLGVRSRIQDIIYPIVYPVVIDSFVGHWPEKYKLKIKDDFIVQINDAELHYARCQKLIAQSANFDENVLIQTLSQRIFGVMGYSTEWDSLSETNKNLASTIQTWVYQALEKMQLVKLVEDAWPAILTMEQEYGPNVFEQINIEATRLENEANHASRRAVTGKQHQRSFGEQNWLSDSYGFLRRILGKYFRL